MNDSAVWAANGEFEMSAERARELAWIATGGQTGVIGPGSLQVRAQETPGDSVRIFPGGFSIQATPEGSIGYSSAPWQSYMRALCQTLTVPIRATGSSGGRIDVVGLVIDDPQYEGTSDSVDWDAHQFFRPHVVENVSVEDTLPHHFSSLRRPFLPLARVTIPASTATIADSMIRDLRYLAVRREWTVPPILTTLSSTWSHSDSNGVSQELDQMGRIDIPPWATNVKIDGEIVGAESRNGWSRGDARLRMWIAGEHILSYPIPWQSPDDPVRFTIPIADSIEIPEHLRGRYILARFVLRMHAGPGTLFLFKGGTFFRLRLTFEEAPTHDLLRR